MNQELTPSEIAALAELINDENEDLWLEDLSTQSESDGETFYGSNYPTAESSEAKNRAFIAIALEGMSKEDREIVLRTAMSTDIKVILHIPLPKKRSLAIRLISPHQASKIS